MRPSTAQRRTRRGRRPELDAVRPAVHDNGCSFAGSVIQPTMPPQPRPQFATSWRLTTRFPRLGPANSSLLPHGPRGLPRTAPCTRMTCRCVAQGRCSSRTRPRTCSWDPVRRHLEVRRERRSIGTLDTFRISCHSPCGCDSNTSAQHPRLAARRVARPVLCTGRDTRVRPLERVVMRRGDASRAARDCPHGNEIGISDGSNIRCPQRHKRRRAA